MAFAGEKNQEHGWGKLAHSSVLGSPRQRDSASIWNRTQVSRCLRPRMTVSFESSPWCSVSAGQNWAHSPKNFG